MLSGLINYLYYNLMKRREENSMNEDLGMVLKQKFRDLGEQGRLRQSY